MIRSLDGVSPRIHRTAFVSEFAYVIGDVEIGEGSSIWPGSVVRADMGRITIGRFTCVQDNSVVHGDADVVIGDNAVIGHRVMCHAKSVGDRVLIGNGATVNDGVEIGEDSLLASGTMVVDNMNIPPRSLIVGVPGRIRGRVEERHIELIKHYCEIYIHKAERYKRQGDLESAANRPQPTRGPNLSGICAEIAERLGDAGSALPAQCDGRSQHPDSCSGLVIWTGKLIDG